MSDGPTRRPAGLDELPLTPGQERLWFIDRLHPGWPTHDELVFRLRGPLDPGRLATAFTLALRGHEAPWARFADRDGTPVQLMPGPDREHLHVPLEHLTVPGDTLAERVERARELVGPLRVAPFDLATGPLIRLTLLTLDPDDHVLVMVMHHIITDGSSWPILLRQVRSAYADPDAFGPQPAAVDFGDYVLWQQDRRETAQAHLEHWTERLDGIPVLRLPTDFVRPAERDPHGATLHHLIDARLAAAVEQTARRLRCTPFMLLLAAYQVLLARHSGQDDFGIGTPTAGRPHPALEPVVGLFINIVVLRADLAGDPTFADLLLRTRRRTMEALSRQEIPFESIIRSLGTPRDAGTTPLFQTMFVLHTEDSPGTDLLPGIAAEEFDNTDSYAFYDLTVDLWRTEAGLSAMLRYDTELFAEPTARLLLQQYEAVLRAVVADPNRPVSRIELGGDRAELAGPAGNTTGATVPAEFEAAVRRHPDATAVSCAGRTLTYAELDAAANRLARVLRRNGVGPETVVAVPLPRSPDLVVALLAVWKAGGAYLPLDPAYPPARLELLRTDSGARHELTVDDLVAAQAESDAAPDWPAPGPGDLAYLIYTSGTTGRPKGVCVPHSAVAARVAWMREHYAISPADRVLQLATVSFDTHVEEVYPALTGGAELVLLPAGAQLPGLPGRPGRGRAVRPRPAHPVLARTGRRPGRDPLAGGAAADHHRRRPGPPGRGRPLA